MFASVFPENGWFGGMKEKEAVQREEEARHDASQQ